MELSYGNTGHYSTTATTDRGLDSSHFLPALPSRLSLHSLRTNRIYLPAFLVVAVVAILCSRCRCCCCCCPLAFAHLSCTSDSFLVSSSSFVYFAFVLVHVTCMRLFAWPSTCTKVFQMTLRVGVAPPQCIAAKTAKKKLVQQIDVKMKIFVECTKKTKQRSVDDTGML